MENIPLLSDRIKRTSASSIKTRIKTELWEYKPHHAVGVRVHHPLKQGLRQIQKRLNKTLCLRTSASSIKTRIKTC